MTAADLGAGHRLLAQILTMVNVCLSIFRRNAAIIGSISSATDERSSPLKKSAKATLYAICILFLMAGLTHCSENLPTTNAVQAIDLTALDKIITDNSFRGLVVAMASWCPPCREELPILAKLYDKYQEKGVQIIAISLDTEGPQAVQPLINRSEVRFPVYWVGTQAVQHFKIVGIPMTMVYREGKLVEKLPGSHSKRVIEAKIKSLVAAKN